MNKILLIIRREYLTRVRKRSFIVMTILGPILMAAMFVLPVYFATRQEDKREVHIIDETGLFINKFQDNANYTFIPLYTDLETAKAGMKGNPGTALLFIPRTQLNVPEKAVFYSNTPPTINLQGYITSVLNREIEKLKLAAEIRKEIRKAVPGQVGDTASQDLMSETILKNIRSSVQLTTIKIDEEGSEKKSYTEAYMIAGMFSSIMIYMFIFIFGSQVMRGVIEEKTNRIIEVIISSVKPFQLMMGKIIGVAMVGLTQFLLWVLLTFIIVTAVQVSFPETFRNQSRQSEALIGTALPGGMQSAGTDDADAANANEAANVVIEAISSINFPVLIFSFVFFFIGGYLLYGALFAAIGSAVDNDADTQQFMLPITVPLILSIMLMQSVTQNPDGPLAFWFSIIPLTSPVIMMVRIPFGVPYGELALSMALLVLGFIFTTWLAAKIYRTGILMYGKKVNYRELWKWVRYKG